MTHTNATPCNDHHRQMGDIVAERIEELGGKPFIFGTPVVSDGEVLHRRARAHMQNAHHFPVVPAPSRPPGTPRQYEEAKLSVNLRHADSIAPY